MRTRWARFPIQSQAFKESPAKSRNAPNWSPRHDRKGGSELRWQNQCNPTRRRLPRQHDRNYRAGRPRSTRESRRRLGDQFIPQNQAAFSRVCAERSFPGTPQARHHGFLRLGARSCSDDATLSGGSKCDSLRPSNMLATAGRIDGSTASSERATARRISSRGPAKLATTPAARFEATVSGYFHNLADHPLHPRKSSALHLAWGVKELHFLGRQSQISILEELTSK